VRLAQRIPVRIHLDDVPPGIVLSAGMTATVEIEERRRAGRLPRMSGGLASTDRRLTSKEGRTRDGGFAD
jgi:multidrug resistance efflux pump